MAGGERQIKRAQLIGPRNYRTVWQKLHYERAQEMQKAREEAAPEPAVTPRTVLSAPRPEFGPPAVVRDGDFIDQRRLLPPARTATAKKVSGLPQPGFGAPKATVAQPTARSIAGQPWPRPDPSTAIRVTNMAPAMSMLQDRKTELPPGVRIENGYPTYRPDNLQRQVMRDHLSARNMPIEQIEDLKFVQGMDQDAGFFTRQAFKWINPQAVTQGNTVYVRPDKFDEVARFKSDTPFEEAYHSADFAAKNGAGFYPSYFANLIAGLLATGDAYMGNTHEAFAQGAAKEMYRYYQGQRRSQRK